MTNQGYQLRNQGFRWFITCIMVIYYPSTNQDLLPVHELLLIFLIPYSPRARLALCELAQSLYFGVRYHKIVFSHRASKQPLCLGSKAVRGIYDVRRTATVKSWNLNTAIPASEST